MAVACTCATISSISSRATTPCSCAKLNPHSSNAQCRVLACDDPASSCPAAAAARAAAAAGAACLACAAFGDSRVRRLKACLLRLATLRSTCKHHSQWRCITGRLLALIASGTGTTACLQATPNFVKGTAYIKRQQYWPCWLLLDHEAPLCCRTFALHSSPGRLKSGSPKPL